MWSKLKEGMSAEDVDPEKAVELGRERRVDLVIVGTIIEANSKESERNINGPYIFGQSAGLAGRSMKAVVTIQGDLFNVVNGKQIGSFRATGKASDTRVGANVSTTLGELSNSAVSDKSPHWKGIAESCCRAGKEHCRERIQDAALCPAQRTFKRRNPWHGTSNGRTAGVVYGCNPNANNLPRHRQQSVQKLARLLDLVYTACT